MNHLSIIIEGALTSTNQIAALTEMLQSVSLEALLKSLNIFGVTNAAAEHALTSCFGLKTTLY